MAKAAKTTDKRNALQIANSVDWQEALRKSSIRFGFQIQLTKAMLEMLCAVTDDVTWDRALFPSLHCPDNMTATQASLVKRGLIMKKSVAEVAAMSLKRETDKTMWEWCHYKLTPAGECVVQLIKLAGIFVEADVAIKKKARLKTG